MNKKISSLLLVLAMVLSLAACGSAPTPDAGTPATATPDAGSPATTTPDAGTPAEGTTTYTASKLGVNGQVEVQVTVDGDKITDVTVTKSQETPGIGAPLYDGEAEGSIPAVVIPKAIVENQSVNVDSVSGATITSYAIKSAVEDCLNQAGLDVSN